VNQFERLLDALAEEGDPHTTARDPAQAVKVHIADSLTGLELEELQISDSIADIGSGPGFPGLALAVALPGARVDLVEAAGRKAAVSERLARAAGVENARTIVARAEDWAARPASAGGGAERYAVVTARALAPLAVLAEYAAPLLRTGGVLVAWKGAREEAEEGAGAAAAALLGLEPEQPRRVSPFPGAERHHLHVLRKIRATPAGYPRRAGMARKRPLA
jgi:16S rRNA (guanine527-N7)-methyltransferase